MKNIDEYLKFTDTTAIYPDAGTGRHVELIYLALGLSGESGEVAEKIKKSIRDGKLDLESLKMELGDVFWYLTRLCAWCGVNPSEVLKLNIEKLSSRRDRNKLKGSGDDR